MSINGLNITDGFITSKEETELLNIINNQTWNTDISRRTQHYGFEYNYTSRSINNNLGQLPNWLDDLCNKIHKKFKIKKPDQVIINEYISGQGISPHIDKIDVFDKDIFSLSLGFNDKMKFEKGDDKHIVELSRCSIVHMNGDCRYKYKHSISAKKRDNPRVSLTFRKIL
jgi:alkylated DNA repair dioxygenase AlkB